jgi:transposase
MKNTIGRPRMLTDEQVAKILAWHEELSAWRAMGAHLKSLRQLARELGVSPSTVLQVIHSRGSYKKSSPDIRGSEVNQRRRRATRARTHR